MHHEMNMEKRRRVDNVHSPKDGKVGPLFFLESGNNLKFHKNEIQPKFSIHSPTEKSIPCKGIYAVYNSCLQVKIITCDQNI